MTITDIRILLMDDPRLKAFVTVTFDHVFVVKGLKIIHGKTDRLFLAMPSRQRPSGEYQDIVHPVHQAFRNILEETVFLEYSRCLRAAAQSSRDVHRGG
jgi:stage V sporulation protein G